MHDSDPWIRSQALLAIEEILSPSEKRRALPGAETLLNDPDLFVRNYAEKLLPKFVLPRLSSGRNIILQVRVYCQQSRRVGIRNETMKVMIPVSP